MTRLPEVVAVQHLTDSLRALGEPPKKGQPIPIDELEARMIRAVRRDLTGLPIADGYPTSTLGDERSAPTIVVADEAGQPDVVAVTTVEASVDGLGGRPLRDQHHELTIKAVGALEDAVVAVQLWKAALASIDDLIKTDGPGAKIRTCAHCSGKRGKGEGNDRAVHATGTVGDRLERAIALCAACYGFVVQTAPAASREGRLPDDRQIADHEARGRWNGIGARR